jgi:hypothetical protein
VRGGWFVPLSVNREGCIWRVWFVPDDPRAPSVASTQGDYEEFDIHFTLATHVEHFGDDRDELVVVRGYEHPEGVASGSTVYRHLMDGRVLTLPFDTLHDEDGDGALDGVLEFETQEGDFCRLDTDVWARIDHRGPSLVAHRVPSGGFSLDDAAATLLRQARCSGAEGALLVTDEQGRADDGATARNVVCQAAQGRAASEIAAELERTCVPRGMEDCPEPRPRACFRDTLVRWASRVEQGRQTLAP